MLCRVLWKVLPGTGRALVALDSWSLLSNIAAAPPRSVLLSYDQSPTNRPP